MDFSGLPPFSTYLLHILTFGDPLVADFHSRVTQALDEVSRVQAHQICNFVCICTWILSRGSIY